MCDIVALDTRTVETVADEVVGLRAENARLRMALSMAPHPKHFQVLVEAMSEVKATSDGVSTQPIATIVAWCVQEISMLPRR